MERKKPARENGAPNRSENRKTSSRKKTKVVAKPKKPEEKKIRGRVSASKKTRTPKKENVSDTVRKTVAEKKTAPQKKVIKKPPLHTVSDVKNTGKKSSPPRVKAPQKKRAAQKVDVRKKETVPKTSGAVSGERPSAGKKRYLPSHFKGQGNVKPKYFFNANIPDAYNKTYIRALPRDPYWLFIYWEVTQQSIEKEKNNMGAKKFDSARSVLRVFDVTESDNAQSNQINYFDIEINKYANNWYLKVSPPGRTFLIKYGLLATDGTFYEIVQSNLVQTPRDNVSDSIDEKWLTSSTDELIKISKSQLFTKPGASERMAPNPLLQGQEAGERAEFPGASENLFSGSSFQR